MKDKKIVEMLDHDLTEDEIRELGKELAKLEKEHETVKGELSNARKIFNKKLGDLRTQIDRMSNDIVRKKQERKTTVMIRADLDRGVKLYTRTDTDQVVREESMTEGEIANARQTGMFPTSDEEAEKSEPIEEKAKRKKSKTND